MAKASIEKLKRHREGLGQDGVLFQDVVGKNETRKSMTQLLERLHENIISVRERIKYNLKTPKIVGSRFTYKLMDSPYNNMHLLTGLILYCLPHPPTFSIDPKDIDKLENCAVFAAFGGDLSYSSDGKISVTLTPHQVSAFMNDLAVASQNHETDADYHAAIDECLEKRWKAHDKREEAFTKKVIEELQLTPLRPADRSKIENILNPPSGGASSQTVPPRQ